LADFAAKVLLWRDRYVPPEDAVDDWLGASLRDKRRRLRLQRILCWLQSNRISPASD